jgi:hypothetical protein
VYKDPKSGYNYQVIEKKLNNTLIKTAIAFLGLEQPISLEEIPKEFLKIEHPNKANVMKLMKNRLMALQEENKRLLENQHKSLYQKIKDNLNGKTDYETDDLYYCLHSGLVLPMKKKHYARIDDALSVLEDWFLSYDSRLLITIWNLVSEISRHTESTTLQMIS